MSKKQKWIIFGKLWLEHCNNCKKETRHRFLNCDKHGGECDCIVCCECGESPND